MRLITTEAQRHREIEDGKDPTTSPIIGAAIEIHPNLGPGFLESAYEECLCHELHLRGLDCGIEGGRKASARQRGTALDLPEIDR
jgi:hypothetical protein